MSLKTKLIVGFSVLLLITFVIARNNIIVWFIPKPYPDMTAEEVARLEPFRRDAYNEAIRCSDTKTPELRYEDIAWVVIPENRIHIVASDGRLDLGGYFSPNDSVIYLPYPNRDKRWVLVHESLHAIGYRGHPDIPFRFPCRVMADQHY